MSHGKSVIRGTRLLVSAKSSRQSNPAEAAELAMQHATEAERVALLEQVGRLWPDVDAPAASFWLAHLEAGPERDAAVGAFVRELFETHPEASLVWSASRSDERETLPPSRGTIHPPVGEGARSRAALARNLSGFTGKFPSRTGGESPLNNSISAGVRK